MNYFGIAVGVFQAFAAGDSLARGDWRMTIVWSCFALSSVLLSQR